MIYVVGRAVTSAFSRCETIFAGCARDLRACFTQEEGRKVSPPCDAVMTGGSYVVRLRETTGDDRYYAALDKREQSLAKAIMVSCYRPFGEMPFCIPADPEADVATQSCCSLIA